MDECRSGLAASSKGPFQAFTWHQSDFGDKNFAGQCFGTTSDDWSPRAQNLIISRRLTSSNIWVADIGAQVTEVPGLRRGGQRMVRAKYPNDNPEQSGTWLRGAGQGMGGGNYIKGWINQGTWVAPFRKPDSEEIVVNDADWPSVEVTWVTSISVWAGTATTSMTQWPVQQATGAQCTHLEGSAGTRRRTRAAAACRHT